MAILKNLTINDTGFVQLPVGSTSQRGNGGETVVSFTTEGTTSWTCPANVSTIRILVVGGGGAGGWDVGGGGGAGGVVYNGQYTVTPGGSYTVTVGSGGTGNTSSSTRGGQGGSSLFYLTSSGSGSGITAYGGGGGADWAGNTGGGGSTVGSAGGGTSNITTQAVTTSGQGNNGGVPGGNTSPGDYSYSGASGGGGAGKPGGPGIVWQADGGFEEGIPSLASGQFSWTAASTKYGYGGDGLAFDISGSVQWYAGGGGSSSDNSAYWGVGGKGGGGNGGGRSDCNATFFGGGGGGGGAGGFTGSTGNQGGSGYKGCVIIAYGAQTGYMRYNSTTGRAEMLGKASSWEGVASGMTASYNGTVTAGTLGGGQVYRQFTGPGQFIMNTPGTVEVLLVGGGGGGADISGGGGAGGYVYQAKYHLSAGIYPVTVGTGGAGSTNWYNDSATAGNPTSFADLEAKGGGAGAHYTYSSPPTTAPAYTGSYPAWKSNGGSGGGGPGGHWYIPQGGIHGNPNNSRGQASANIGGGGIAGQGHPGGYGSHGAGWGNFPGPGVVYSGGGGGGAGARGGNINDCDARATGGRGMASAITGNVNHYAGGGGGGLHGPGNSQHYGVAFTEGGVGGGGRAGGPGSNGTNGTANTGGGGGGGHHPSPDLAGSGGSGVAIIRYLGS